MTIETPPRLTVYELIEILKRFKSDSLVALSNLAEHPFSLARIESVKYEGDVVYLKAKR